MAERPPNVRVAVKGCNAEHGCPNSVATALVSGTGSRKYYDALCGPHTMIWLQRIIDGEQYSIVTLTPEERAWCDG